MAFTTKGSLLAAVKKGDEISWQQFYDMYKPLILLKGGDLRLNQTEKEETCTIGNAFIFQYFPNILLRQKQRSFP